MDIFTLAALASALLLAGVHVITPSMRFLSGTPRSIWLSIAGGVSVAYVFVHLLPELAEGQRTISEGTNVLGAIERHVYLLALVGLATFYGLDRLAKLSRSQRGGAPVRHGRGGEGQYEERADLPVFWIHIGSFALYNVLIGYLLLHREVDTLTALVFFALAMALHFLVSDYGLEEDHQEVYRRIGRWILVGAVLLGFAVGLAVEVSEAAVAALIAFLAGGVILTVLKEEVPSERESRFWAFALGMAGYAGLLLAI